MSGEAALTAAGVENSLVSVVAVSISQPHSAHAAPVPAEPAQSQPAGSDPCSRKRDDSVSKHAVVDTGERLLLAGAKP
jgi:hypothetical protein